MARPGFDAFYKIIYKNKGNQVESGSVNLTFDDSKMDFVSASATPIQSTGLLTWDYTNLQPFETKTIDEVENPNDRAPSFARTSRGRGFTSISRGFVGRR